MNSTIKLEGVQYDEGSRAHLAKIEQLHELEIAKHTKAHVQDVSQRQHLEHQTRVLTKELKDGVRDQTEALAEANAAIQESEERFLRLVNSVKDYALYTLDASENVAS